MSCSWFWREFSQFSTFGMKLAVGWSRGLGCVGVGAFDTCFAQGLILKGLWISSNVLSDLLRCPCAFVLHSVDEMHYRVGLHILRIGPLDCGEWSSWAVLLDSRDDCAWPQQFCCLSIFTFSLLLVLDFLCHLSLLTCLVCAARDLCGLSGVRINQHP